MHARKNILVLFFVINMLVMLESTRFILQYLFFQPGIQTHKKTTPKIEMKPAPLNLETVLIKPKAAALPPLPPIRTTQPSKVIEQAAIQKTVLPTIVKPAVLLKLTLDHFNHAGKKNNIGGLTGTFGGTGGFCLESYQKVETGNSAEASHTLKLVYNVNNGYAGYYSKLNGADLSKYKQLSFLVHGIKGGEIFEVELGDGVNAAKLDIREYLPYGTSTSWQKVKIPLKDFGEVKKWQQMNGNFAIVFEQYLGSPTNSTVYLDNVTFE